MKLFLDNNLPRRVALALAALYGPEGQEIVHLKDRFPDDTADQEWLSVLAEEGGWVAVTRDRRIGKNPKQRHMWWQSDLLVFFLDKSWEKHRGIDQCRQLIHRWPDIVAVAEKPKGKGFLMGYHGRIRPIF
ncbi:MAG: hypothetical protein GY842_25480 [bacterium]|nr:hypothetical protein [bacterium]